MMDSTRANLIETFHYPIQPPKPRPSYDKLLESFGDARLVLIGDSIHGTYQFFDERAYVTQRLIADKAFTSVIVEGDFLDCYQINRYIHGAVEVSTPLDSLKDFQRFPLWMWCNEVMLPFMKWMKS
ncbi:hypothetical protein SmJEL517_g05427 [Synchytrium microbalum]|uniref:Uncharacterized protein n=1 Tax=Synchytrium microbalum TaxID=1806994 RepID=A0A507BVD5_9FUNG|nr:uncharacterized protein SmJEL517_g05427 [Synchytrium microbalum]TPX31198.1 hypothetical protein SmJEL517_g05427 [Synchytrium microbalum]